MARTQDVYGWETIFEREAAQAARLTPEQERALSARVMDCRALGCALLLGSAASEHQRLAAALLADARDAWEALIAANTLLVVSIVRGKLGGAGRIGSLRYKDLLQSGNKGLMIAAARYDYRDERGARFGTVASWWIRQAINRAVAEESRHIHRPIYVSTALSKGARLTREYRQETRDPDALPSDAWLLDHGMTDIQLRAFRAGAPAEPVSVEGYVVGERDGDGEQLHLSSALADERSARDLDAVESDLDAETLLKTLRHILSERQMTVLLMRHGVDGPKRTLEECGRLLGCKRSRVSQIEQGARLALLRAGIQLDGTLGAPRSAKEARALLDEGKPKRKTGGATGGKSGKSGKAAPRAS